MIENFKITNQPKTFEEWKDYGMFKRLTDEQSLELYNLISEIDTLLETYKINDNFSLLYPIITRIYNHIAVEDIKPFWLSSDVKKLINIKELVLEFFKNVHFVEVFDKYFEHLDSEAEFCSLFTTNYLMQLNKELKKQND